MREVVPAEYSQTPPTATYFHFWILRRNPTRRTRPMSMGKIRRVINYKLRDLTKCQHAPKLFQPSTLKRHQRRLISTSGFCAVGGVLEYSAGTSWRHVDIMQRF